MPVKKFIFDKQSNNKNMAILITRFINAIVVALLAGTSFGI